MLLLIRLEQMLSLEERIIVLHAIINGTAFRFISRVHFHKGDVKLVFKNVICRYLNNNNYWDFRAGQSPNHFPPISTIYFIHPPYTQLWHSMSNNIH